VSRFRLVVLDTSTLVSAAIRSGSVPHQAFVKALDTCFPCLSGETLAELEDVLYRRKFDRYLDRESRNTFLDLVHRGAYRFPLAGTSASVVQPACRDPKDDKFLALAVAAEADVLVSSDKDLLVLHPWRGIGIVTPAEFVGEG